MTVYTGHYKSKHYYVLINAQCALCSTDGPEVQTSDGRMSSKNEQIANGAAENLGWKNVTVDYFDSKKSVMLCPSVFGRSSSQDRPLGSCPTQHHRTVVGIDPGLVVPINLT